MFMANVRRVSLLLGVGALAATWQARAQTSVVQGELGRRMDSLVSGAASNGFHGNILVAQRGTIVLLKGYGLSNEAARTPYGPSTLVQIGSCVKDFTKVAIYQLVEAGRLSLTDSLGRFVDRLPQDKRGITVQHLLQHHAGLPLGVAGDDVPLSADDMLSRLNGLTLLSVPGAQERYSNLGYALLAFIIERTTGQAYDEYIAEHVLRPSGLTETGSFLPRFDRSRIARGYSGTSDIGVILDMPHDASGHLWSLRGNGGYLSTLRDMQRFYLALADTTLLRDAAHRRAVFKPEEPIVLAGSDLTSFFLFASFPGRETQVLIASNHSAYPGNRLIRAVESLLGPPPGDNGPRIVTTEGPGERPQSGGPLVDHLPDNGAGRTVAAFLEAYNSGDTSVMRRFYVEHAVTGEGTPPIAARLERYQTMRGNLGRLTLRGVRPGGEGLAVVVTTEQGDEATLTFMLEPDPSNRLQGIRVEVG